MNFLFIQLSNLKVFFKKIINKKIVANQLDLTKQPLGNLFSFVLWWDQEPFPRKPLPSDHDGTIGNSLPSGRPFCGPGFRMETERKLTEPVV